MVLLYRNRVATLSRLFPWIHPEVSEILERFSVGATGFYHDLDTLISDVLTVLRICGRGA